MDWQSILTTLWGKVSKPIPNFLIGLVFIYAAPDGPAWAGLIFIALGISGLVEWLWPKFNSWKEVYKWKKRIKGLSSQEFEALNLLRQKQSCSIPEHATGHGADQHDLYTILRYLEDLQMVRVTANSRYTWTYDTIMNKDEFNFT